MNRIEELISEFEHYIEECKPQAFSGSRKIIVERGVVDDFLTELSMCMPDVIDKSQKIVDNQESIISDAQDQADRLIEEAQARTEAMVDEHEIVQKAIEKGNDMYAEAQQTAQKIIDDATAQADQIVYEAQDQAENLRTQIVNYTDGALNFLQQLYDENFDRTRDLFENHMRELSDICEKIRLNHEDFIGSSQDYPDGPADEPYNDSYPEEDGTYDDEEDEDLED